MPRPLPLALALLLVAGCDTSTSDASVTAAVVDDAQLSTFEAALIVAGLDAPLADEGAAYTVFAPTDAAFAALLDALGTTPADLLARDDLADIVRLHVVAGTALGAGDLTAGTEVTTLAGETLTVVAAGGRVGVDGDGDAEADATVVETGVQAANGVIHKVDAVLLPAGG